MGAIRVAAVVSFFLIIATYIIAYIRYSPFSNYLFFWISVGGVGFATMPIVGLLSSFFLWTLRPWAWYSHMAFTLVMIISALVNRQQHLREWASLTDRMHFLISFCLWVLILILLARNQPRQWKQSARIENTADTSAPGEDTSRQRPDRRLQIGQLEKIGMTLMVLAVLVMVGCPILGMVIARAREAQWKRNCQANLRTLMTAVEMYAQDHGGWYPGTHWYTAIEPYVPTATMPWMCPHDPSGDIAYPLSYASNASLIGLPARQVIRPNAVGVLADTNWPSRRNDGGKYFEVDIDGRQCSPDPRHNGINIAYCDGHVTFIKGKIIPADNPNHPFNTAFFRAKELGYIADKP